MLILRSSGNLSAYFCVLAAGAASAVWGAETDPPAAKPVPEMQVLPLPYDQAAFQHRGIELTRLHFAPTLKRPFLYPLAGPEGRSLTRMGHPHDPVTHDHHNSVWISHQSVQGENFWENQGNPSQIVCQRVDQYGDGPPEAWALMVNAWRDRKGRVVMQERRRVGVQWLEKGQFEVTIDLELHAPSAEPVLLGQSPFGMIGVRMAKPIGVHDGGGRILNSEGQRNEEECFRKPARWMDYSGAVTNQSRGGITLMDHPGNPGHPTPFHVRNDGWMGICLTLRGAMKIEPGKPLRLRYGLWAHEGLPTGPQSESRWEVFARGPLPSMERGAQWKSKVAGVLPEPKPQTKQTEAK